MTARKETIRILLTGGGSGGHVYPLVAVAREIERLTIENNKLIELYYLGPVSRHSSSLESAGVRVRKLIYGKLRRYASIANIIDIPKFFIGIFQALFRLYFIMPNVIFSKGGTGALAVILAGWFYRIPVIIHESDAIPGLNNSISSRFAARIAVSFEKALEFFPPEKTALVGNPIRKELIQNIPTPEAAKDELRFIAEEPITLVIGGSQGSERLNNFVLANLKELLDLTQVLHQTGEANFAKIEKLGLAALGGRAETPEGRRRYQAVPYLDKDLKIALAASDLVITRAGSGTIFEIAAFGKPAILIPLPESANDHQRANAYEFSKLGGAIVLEEQNLLPRIFLGHVRGILGTPGEAERMGGANRKLIKPDAAEIMAKEILKLASQKL